MGDTGHRLHAGSLLLLRGGEGIRCPVRELSESNCCAIHVRTRHILALEKIAGQVEAAGTLPGGL